MRFILMFWLLIEVLQMVVIGMLVVGYRNLQRRLDGDYNFRSNPPRSVTEE